MARSFSSSFKTNLNTLSNASLPIVGIEIDHPNLTNPIRLVNDAKDIVSQTNSYIACPFDISIINDSDKEQPKATLTITNIGREITRWIEQTQGGSQTTVTINIFSRSEPDTIEYSVKLDFTEITVTPQTISGSLGFENLYRKTAINKFFTPKTAPGIFNSSLD